MSVRTGILGGSFNPPHNGHLAMAAAACAGARLDRVLFVPAAAPPHKLQHNGMAPAEDRLAMVREAIAGHAAYGVWDGELRRGGVSYTVDTLRQLRAEFPEDRFVLIIGGDTLRDLHTWREPVAIVEMAEVVTLVRPGVSVPGMRPQLPPPWPERLLAGIVPAEPVDVSSTEIRRRVAAGDSIAQLVPAGVAAYIRRHGLYTT